MTAVARNRLVPAALAVMAALVLWPPASAPAMPTSTVVRHVARYAPVKPYVMKITRVGRPVPPAYLSVTANTLVTVSPRGGLNAAPDTLSGAIIVLNHTSGTIAVSIPGHLQSTILSGGQLWFKPAAPVTAM